MFLLDLPNEILLCIANSLDQARDLLTLAFLNRTTKFLFPDCLYRFNVRHQRNSALSWGVCQGNSDFVERMLSVYHADASTTDRSSRMPIFQAIRTRNDAIIRTLLADKRADTNWQDQHRQTPLIYAIERNRLPTASLPHDFDSCLKIMDAKNRSAIWYAIAFCDENLLQVLLERGSDIRTPDYKRFSPFSLAIAKKTPRIARLLLHHSDSNSRKTLLEDVTIRKRLLRQAVQASLHDVISLLVAHGADPNPRNRNG